MKQPTVLVVAPCPLPSRIREGWMSRISAIDSEFDGFRRIYLNFASHHDDQEVAVHWYANDLGEAFVNPQGVYTRLFLERWIDEASVLYVHTLHLAEHVMDWLATGKVVVDIHGVTPEEEVMMGRQSLREKFEAIEVEVLQNAVRCVAVSRSMTEHYKAKYPKIPARWIVVPVFESYSSALNLAVRDYRLSLELPVSVVYAGGAQPWQNIDAMVSMAERTRSFARFEFLSQDQGSIKNTATKYQLRPDTVFAFCEKNALPDKYRNCDFGLLLRDESAVNRVSSPTKLIEYILFGAIPIVRSPNIGDFSEFGYAYVLEEEFCDGFFPDRISRQWMAETNVSVAHALAGRFADGARDLKELILSMA